jgi:hypothetical protein
MRLPQLLQLSVMGLTVAATTPVTEQDLLAVVDCTVLSPSLRIPQTHVKGVECEKGHGW